MVKIIKTQFITPDTPLSANHNDWIYNGLDCCVTLEIRDQLLPLLDSNTKKTYDFELALQGPVMEMSMQGVLRDKVTHEEALSEIRARINFLSKDLTKILIDGLGLDINWRSPTQLKKLFYEIMELKSIKKRSVTTGKYVPSVDREALETLCNYMVAEPICLILLRLRDLDKKRQFLETEIDKDGRFRCSFNIAGTNTGRLSSSLSEFGTGSNLQNVDRTLRYAFVADPGYKFGNFDLEQGDSRNLGALCWNIFVESHGETFAGSYLEACQSSDLHTSVAKMVWKDMGWTGDKKKDREIADVLFYREDSYRQLAKKLGHGTNYYGQPPTMAKHTRVGVHIIDAFQRGYFGAFPCIPAYHRWVKEQLLEGNPLVTLFYRQRHFFGSVKDDATLREAIAFSPQSMTADAIDTALLQLYRTNRFKLCIQVHDSILLMYREEEEAELVDLALRTMRVTIPLKRGREFVLPVDAKVGWNWGDVEYDKAGNVIKNPNGLVKWKGSDTRKRIEQKPKAFLDRSWINVNATRL